MSDTCNICLTWTPRRSSTRKDITLIDTKIASILEGSYSGIRKCC